MSMNPPPVKDVVEAALLSAGQPLTMERLSALFGDDERPDPAQIRAALDALSAEWEGRPLELRQVAGGFRFQVRSELAPWIGRLAEERPPRYSRALLETLALIVYRQPITRAAIEEIRGVSVSSQIIRTLMEREWIRVVGHRDVPGKPALYGTTKRFLDYFSLRSLSELPPLPDIRPLDHGHAELGFDDGAGDGETATEEVRGARGQGAEAGEGAEEAERSPARADLDDDEAQPAEGRETAHALS